MQFSDTAIFCDLDGTLFTPAGTIGEKTVRAIRHYTENGGLFAPGTGRSPFNIRPFMDASLFNSPGIVLNGAGCYDFTSDKWHDKIFADRPAIERTVAFALTHCPGMNIQVYTEAAINYVTPRETANEGFLSIHSPCRFTTVAEIADVPWFKALLFGTPEQTVLLESFLQDNGLLHAVDTVISGTDIVKDARYLEILPKGINKGSMLTACRSLPCYENRTFFAAGDGMNDYEMLVQADFGAAPRNARSEVLAIAGIPLPSNKEDPIAHLIACIAAL